MPNKHLKILNRVIREGAVSLAQESIGTVLRVIRQLPLQVDSCCPTEVDWAGICKNPLPFCKTNWIWRIYDFVRHLPLYTHYSERSMWVQTWLPILTSCTFQVGWHWLILNGWHLQKYSVNFVWTNQGHYNSNNLHCMILSSYSVHWKEIDDHGWKRKHCL